MTNAHYPLALLLALLPCLGLHAEDADTVWCDVTDYFLTNPDFSNGTSGWTYTTDAYNSGVAYGVMEFWYAYTFDIHQELTDLPNGTYRVGVQAFYSDGNSATSYAAHEAGTEQLAALFYANDSEQAVVSRYSWHATAKGSGWWVEPSTGYFSPNDREAVCEAFEQDAYHNSLLTQVSDGTLTLGIRCSEGVASNWCPFDNFTLEYAGDLSTYFSGTATAEQLIVNEVMVGNIDECLDPTCNFSPWIELYNPTDTDATLSLHYVSNDAENLTLWRMPAAMGTVPARGWRVIWFDHTDLNNKQAPFKLAAEGGTLYFSDTEGQLITQHTYPALCRHAAYGRTSDGGDDWAWTEEPTPGATNATATFVEGAQLEAPDIDQPSQLLSGALQVGITVPDEGQLVYTTDGSLPTATNGTLSATGLITITDSTTLRVRTIADGFVSSDATSRTYVYPYHTYTLPLLTVLCNPAYLYDDSIGIYVEGTNGITGRGVYTPVNYNQPWERPVNFSYITTDGQMALNQDVNMEIAGGWSRASTPRSFKLKGSKIQSGDKHLKYPFFAAKPHINNRTLQVRNGGNDNTYRLIDPVISTIVQTSNIDIDLQSYQPAHIFFNNTYMGTMNIREPNNKHYVYANYGWDDDEIDLFEMDSDSGYIQHCGTADAYDQLTELTANADDSISYAQIRQLLDTDAFAAYTAAGFYLSSNDWGRNNVKGFRWRGTSPDDYATGGKYRFVLYDSDAAFNASNPFTLFFGYEYKTYTGGYQQVKLVTIFHQLLQSDDFRRRFIDNYCLMGGSVFLPSRCSLVIDSLVADVAAARALEGVSLNSKASSLKASFEAQPDKAITAIKSFDKAQDYEWFHLDELTEQHATLQADVPGAHLYVNDTDVPTTYFSGTLFQPVTIRAEAPAGTRFLGWQVEGQEEDDEYYATDSIIPLPAIDSISLTACFACLSAGEREATGLAPVRINEVSAANSIYVSDLYKTSDWVELVNTTDTDIDLEGLYLTDNADKPQKYQISAAGTDASTIIPARGHRIIWCDKEEGNSQLHASFKLAAEGGIVQISAQDGSWCDCLNYPAHDGYHTVGRYPDGQDAAYLFDTPTIDQANRLNSFATLISYEKDATTALHTPLIAADNGLKILFNAQKKAVVLRTNESVLTSALLTIYTAAGELVLATQVDLTGGEAAVDVALLPPAIYTARATTNDGPNCALKFTLR